MTETQLAKSNGGEALDWKTLEAIVTAGDLSDLSPQERTQYYVWRCQAAGLDPKAKPFDFIELNRKLVLYATKACTDQLCASRRLTVALVGRERSDDLLIVTARATDPSGRYTEDVGAVAIAGLRGEPLANATMKAVTKAKRRAVLSLCGLGTMDESEALETPPVRVDTTTGEVLPPASPPPPRTEEEAKAHAGRYLFASARDAGVDTGDAEAMRRLASVALGWNVPFIRDLDAADRATVAEWIRSRGVDEVRSATLAAALPEEEEDGERESDETQRELRLGAVRSEATVQAMESQQDYSGLVR